MDFIEELYYGNINPNEKRYKSNKPYDKAVKAFSDIENLCCYSSLYINEMRNSIIFI